MSPRLCPALLAGLLAACTPTEPPPEVEPPPRRASIAVRSGDLFFPAYRVAPLRERRARVGAAARADRMRADGVVAAAVGIDDLALGLGTLRGLATRAGAPLLTANLVHAATGSAAFAGHRVVERGGIRIGLVGGSPVLEPADPRFEAYAWAGLEARPLVPALAGAARAARDDGAEVVVALLATGTVAADRAMAALPPGLVDLAVTAAGARVDVEVDGGARVHARPEPLARVEGTDSPASGSRYLGARRCAGECHPEALAHWRRTAHARAWQRLVDTRQTLNLDCLPCHATGFGRPGGPATVAGLAPHRNVGCEACHGPGAAHAEDPEVPTAPVRKRTCGGCHRAHGPGIDFARDLAAARARILGPGHGGEAAVGGRSPR